MSDRNYEYDADASFDDLARALGAMLVLTTEIGHREDILAATISQLCDAFIGMLILESGDEVKMTDRDINKITKTTSAAGVRWMLDEVFRKVFGEKW